MTTKAKIFIGIGAVVVVGAAVALNLQSSRIPTTDVEVEEIKAREIVAVVEASGQIEPSVSVDISTDVMGRITSMGAEEGDRVDAGQFLIQIDQTQYEQRVARARAVMDSAGARIEQARANLERAELEFERQKNLHKQNLIPQSIYDEARAVRDVNRATLTASEFDVGQAAASLEEARDLLNKCRIVAPMDGVVIRKNAEVGETAVAGTLSIGGSLLMTIADLSSMETEVEVDETDVVNIRLGQETEIELDAFPDDRFKGTVTRIGNSSVQGASAPGQPQQAANYKVTVRLLEMPDTIRPGLSATARITTATRPDVLTVPIQSLTIREVEPDAVEEDVEEDDAAEPESAVALADTSEVADDPREVPPPEEGTPVPAEDAEEAEKTPKEEKEGVFVVRDGKAVFVPVEVGLTGEKYFEVTGDLQEGDQVVSGPFSAIRNLKTDDAIKTKDEKKGRKKDGSEAS